MSVYLDCAASSPMDPHVLEVCLHYMRDECGNAGSRSHRFGNSARKAVERARDQVAAVTAAHRGDVIFTSGATESNNLAILGLAGEGQRTGRMHLVCSSIEHRAVLEPMEELVRRGFRMTTVPPGPGGFVEPEAVAAAVEDDTLLVSVMHVNNETGVIQPVEEIAQRLAGKPVFYHVDAAQGFAREPKALKNERIDLISISGHKICGPKGIGALISRRRGRERAPLAPLTFGGGQERGLRPGTLPVALIAGLGEAAAIWSADRWNEGLAFRQRLLTGIAPLQPLVNGDLDRMLPFILNVSIPGFEADTIMQAWEDLVAVSSGAACSSASYTCSHVLPADRSASAIRFSWCHLTRMPDTAAMVEALHKA